MTEGVGSLHRYARTDALIERRLAEPVPKLLDQLGPQAHDGDTWVTGAGLWWFVGRSGEIADQSSRWTMTTTAHLNTRTRSARA